jgi:3-hydroxy-9,10-secoandrosta-1,3,5(10)-triene-9,17-dione monooxygenase
VAGLKGSGSKDIDAAVTRLRTDVIELTEMVISGETVTMAQRGQYRWNMDRGCEIAGEAVVKLFHAASGRSVFLDHPLQKRFQDVQAGLGHAFLVPDPLAKSVGGTLLQTSNPEFLL